MAELAQDHTGAKYFLPSATTLKVEADRLNKQHLELKKLVNNGLTLAPIPDNIEYILDLGCGTGIWTLECAKRYPNARVVGVDLTPPTFPEGVLPPNLSFKTFDVDNEWKFEQKFDFIHLRLLTMGMKDWPGLFKKCYNGLKPGGWLQDLGIDMHTRRGNGKDATTTQHYKYMGVLRSALEAVGMDSEAVDHHETSLRLAGFSSIRRFDCRAHIGSWEETIVQEEGSTELSAYVLVIDQVHELLLGHAPGWTRDEADKLWEEAKREVNQSGSEYNFYVLM